MIDAASARAVLLANPSLIKRPVVDWRQKARQADITAGFDAEQWARSL